MFVWGTANPAGEHNESYNGLYLTKHDIDNMVASHSLVGLPVKVEHKGIDIGQVVSSWKNGDKLDILVSLDRKSLEGDITSKFVEGGICQDFSLGYTVELAHSEKTGKLAPSRKIIKEVSVVRRGARPDCHIHAYTVAEKGK
jgi:hypothetical protein